MKSKQKIAKYIALTVCGGYVSLVYSSFEEANSLDCWGSHWTPNLAASVSRVLG